MKRYGLILLLSLFFNGCTAPAPDISPYLDSQKAAVFVFFSVDCPISQSYTFNLNALHDRFAGAGVGFYGVIPGPRVQKDEIDRFQRDYNINFPLISDPALELADLWGALTTPEVIVVNSGGGVVYQGAVDNRYAGLGTPRTVTTEHYLQDALNNFLLGRAIPKTKTEAVGCFIERES